MKKIICVFCLIFISLIINAQEKENFKKIGQDEIRNAIKINMSTYFEDKLGISYPSEIDSLSIGDYISIYTLDLKDTSLINTSNLLFPVILKDEIIFFAKGILGNEKIQIIGIGGDILAKKFNDIKSNFENNQKYAFLNIPEFNSFFLFDENKITSFKALSFNPLAPSSNCLSCIQKSISLFGLIDKIYLYNTKINENENYTK
jgi:hypothetical protein